MAHHGRRAVSPPEVGAYSVNAPRGSRGRPEAPGDAEPADDPEGLADGGEDPVPTRARCLRAPGP